MEERAFSYTRSAINGAALVSVNAMLLAPFAIVEAVRSSNWRIVGGLMLILLVLWIAGAIGGIAYRLLQERAISGSCGYYCRWVIAAEATLLGFLAVTVLLWQIFWREDEYIAGAKFTPALAISHPLLFLVFVGMAAVAGLIYGYILKE